MTVKLKPIYSYLVLVILFALNPLYSQVVTTFSNITQNSNTGDTRDSYGVSWADYDNDGDLDLFVATYSNQPNRLFRNDGNDVFVDVAHTVGLLNNESTNSASWGDYDNDGDLDLFLGQYYQPRFYRNDGQVFTEIGSDIGITHSFNCYSSAWADFDNDGDLDIIATNLDGKNYLYKNNNGFFQNVADDLGISGWEHTRAAAWGDFDNDGDQDLYLCQGISAQSEKDILYLNDNGSFIDVTENAGITDQTYSLGADWGDYDNDGDLDLFVTSAAGQANHFYKNNNGFFEDIALSTNTDLISGNCYSPAWFDYDNDMDLDLFITLSEGFENVLFEQDNGTFTQVQTAAAIGEDIGRSVGLTIGDYNNDGFLDVYVPNRLGENALYKNNGNENNWIVIHTKGNQSNSGGIGSRITVVTGLIKQTREINGGSAESSQNSMATEFGLGSNNQIDSIIVDWPSGTRQTLTHVSTKQILTIEENDSQNQIANLEIATKYVTAGDTVELPVKISLPPDSIINSFQLTLRGYFGKMTFLEISPDSGLINEFSWLTEINENDSTLEIWSAGTQPISGEDILFNLKFSISDTATGFISVSINNAIIDDGTYQIETIDGGIQILNAPFYGDVDLNGQIQAFDASQILQHLVGNIELDPQQIINADVTLDHTISALDASLILQYGVGILDTLPYDTTTLPILQASGELILANQNVQPEEIVDVPVYLTNGNGIYAFNGTINYDQNNLIFEDIIPELANDFQIQYSVLPDGRVKLVGMNTSSLSTDGVLMYLRFRIASNYSGQNAFVSITSWRWNEETIMQNIGFAYLTGIENNNLPLTFDLKQNFPNPFNPVTTIKYDISQKTKVRVTIYNAIGQIVKRLVNETQNPDSYSIIWDGTNNFGERVSSGIYFYQLLTEQYQSTRQMILVR